MAMLGHVGWGRLHHNSYQVVLLHWLRQLKTGKPSHVHLKIAASLHDFVQFDRAWIIKRCMRRGNSHLCHQTHFFRALGSPVFPHWQRSHEYGNSPSSVVWFACSYSHAHHSVFSNKCIDGCTDDFSFPFTSSGRDSRDTVPLFIWGDFLNCAFTFFSIKFNQIHWILFILLTICFIASVLYS